jgi:hypothetical protein
MERLNGLDGAFVSLESPTTHLHILGALVFDPANVPGGAWSPTGSTWSRRSGSA